MYGEAYVSLLASVPQTSLNGSILLLNSGRIRKKVRSVIMTVFAWVARGEWKKDNDERFFTQALFLRRQDNGFYVKTDTVQVLSNKISLAVSVQSSWVKNRMFVLFPSTSCCRCLASQKRKQLECRYSWQERLEKQGTSQKTAASNAM